MDNNLFDDLVASIKEAGAIKRNEIKASRVTELELPDIKEVREKTGLTQAGCLGFLLSLEYDFSYNYNFSEAYFSQYVLYIAPRKSFKTLFWRDII